GYRVTGLPVLIRCGRAVIRMNLLPFLNIKNRRQDHIALHDKAFRYDDPFWDRYRPPNGWGCECSVVSLSEAGAEREGFEVLQSGLNGNPPALVGPDGKAVDWGNFAPEEWQYNPGLEALAPNFARYKNLASIRMADGKTALRAVVDRYRADMDNTRLTQGEFVALLDRMNQKDYAPQNILYQVGNLDTERFVAMEKAGVVDSKIMAMDSDLYHGIADKVADQKIPKDLFEKLYETLQNPERIYENTEPKYPHLGKE
ncbi:MAG TPA: phage minor head protein, partial [Treponema sp.]|nr:phage minor head protein [Treponema sp.]HRS04287.1 phage minor head protein [Treponema sp.]